MNDVKNKTNESDITNREYVHQHFNITALLDILSQDMKSLLNLIPIAQKSIPKMIDSLNTAYSQQNSEDIKAVLHTLRGSAQNMYFTKLAEISLYLEKNLSDLDSVTIEQHLHRINEEWEVLKAIFEDMLQSIA